jgi:hypothetical protein
MNGALASPSAPPGTVPRIAAFLAVAGLILITPGTDMALVASNALNRGRPAARLTAASSGTGPRSGTGAGPETGFWTRTRRQPVKDEQPGTWVARGRLRLCGRDSALSSSSACRRVELPLEPSARIAAVTSGRPVSCGFLAGWRGDRESRKRRVRSRIEAGGSSHRAVPGTDHCRLANDRDESAARPEDFALGAAAPCTRFAVCRTIIRKEAFGTGLPAGE